MKTCLTTIAFLLFITLTSAQQPEKRGYIALTIGPAFPVGDFIDKSFSSSISGKAENGYSNSFINFGYRFGKNLGISAAIFYGEHDVNGSGDNDWWQVTGITAGPQYSFFPGKKFEADLKARFGLLITQKVIDESGNSDGFGDGFGMDIRASLHYNVFKRWCLIAETGYFAANQKYGDGSSGKLQVIVTGLGIGFRF